MTTAQENYSRWLAAEIQAAIDDPQPSIPHEEVIPGWMRSLPA
jgi:hypothetical protein